MRGHPLAAVQFEPLHEGVRHRFAEVDDQQVLGGGVRVDGGGGVVHEFQVPGRAGPADHQQRVPARRAVGLVPVQDAEPEPGDPEAFRGPEIA